MSTERLDLRGRRFGMLEVLEPAPNIGTRTAWRCRCDCGRELVVKTLHLRNGHVKTCGCQGIRERLTLVDGTCVEMLRTRTVRGNNTSGVPGVDWLRKAGRWRATICFCGKRHYLGRFVNFEDAVRVRKEAERRFFDAFLEDYDCGSGEEAGASEQ